MRHLEEMAVFAKVGDLGSISGAARALGLPKSTVSRAVARLEAAYAARLVERTTRSVTLTEIGRAVHGHCQAMVTEAENAEAEVAAYQGHPSGRLRVSAPYVIGHIILKPHIADFLQRFPDIDLQLQLTDRLLSPVTDDFDVVVRVGWLEDSSVVARKITDVNAILLANRAYIEAHGQPESPQELGDHAVIGFPLLGSRAMVLTNGKDRVQVPIWSRFACNDPLMNLEMVQRGLAIAPVASLLAAEPIKSGACVRILPRYSLLDQPSVYALYAGRTSLSPKISVFLDFLTDLATLVLADPQRIALDFSASDSASSLA
jgi:DNA-binding transcriptional LysR family regulator